MSGRDLRSFIAYHRADEEEKLVIQAKTGVLSGKIKPVDYDNLRALAAERRVAGQVALVKVKKLQDLSKFRKEQNVTKQHRAIWLKELVRLNSVAKRLQAEIDMFTNETACEEATKSIFADFEAYESYLSANFNDFKKSTLDPVLNLRDDLKVWLKMAASTSSLPSPDFADDMVQFDNPEQVRETLQSVKSQQQQIIERLTVEQQRLETELNITGIYDSSFPLCRPMQTGIPEEAFDLNCPDLLLKTSVLQEFILIDGKYVERLTELEREHQTVLNVRNGGWSERDHSFFVYVHDQYTHEVQNRRSLYIDCLRKHLPHRSRRDIVDHENWWMRFRFYHRRHHDLLCNWTRDRTELLNRAKVVFSEACRAKELQEERSESLQKQREFCEDLYSKVREWREKKMELIKLEQEMADKRRKGMEAAVAAEEERLKVKRQEQKEKIHEFHERLEAQKKFKEEKERLHLEELQQYLAEQAVYDKERVKFREEEFRIKGENRIKKQEEELAAKEEKERILEAIRQKVRPQVEGDLLRLWSDTAAWQARQKSEDEVCLLKPLYDVKSFTAEQITGDPRFRLEERLREVGLHNVAYARETLAAVKPLHPPRRDMESTVFKTT